MMDILSSSLKNLLYCKTAPLFYNNYQKTVVANHFYLILNNFKKIALLVYTSKSFIYIYSPQVVCFHHNPVRIFK